MSDQRSRRFVAVLVCIAFVLVVQTVAKAILATGKGNEIERILRAIGSAFGAGPIFGTVIAAVFAIALIIYALYKSLTRKDDDNG